mgnify:FL=1|tara:strand:- start:22683 stop:23090 length:408 start_codon:yes stop_codon:yes gene_type:complete
MAITYTTSGSAVFTEDFNLDLYAGTSVDDTAWLDGGAAAGTYPGGLAGFQAKNSNTTNATGGAKLVCGRFTTALANDETLTLSGDATKIKAVIIGDNSTAAAGVTLKQAISAAGVATFKVTSTSDALVTCWMIVE